jgi:hypothetical protein
MSRLMRGVMVMTANRAAMHLHAQNRAADRHDESGTSH